MIIAVTFLILFSYNFFHSFIIIIIIIYLGVFHIIFSWWFFTVFSTHVSSTLLSILADLKNAVVWTVSTSPVIS